MNHLDTIEPLELEEVVELLALEANGESRGASSEISVPIFEKMAPSNGSPDMKGAGDLFLAEVAAESFLVSADSGLHGSASRKWSSLAVALLVHCFLFAALVAAGAPRLPNHGHDSFEVQLIAFSGGSEGKGGGGSKQSLEAGGRGQPKAAPHCPPAMKPEPAGQPPAKEAKPLIERPAHPARVPKKPRCAAVRKPMLRKKIAWAKSIRREKKPVIRKHSSVHAEQTASLGAPDNARAANGPGSGAMSQAGPRALPGAGTGHSGVPAGGVGHGARGGGGVMEVGFGSANGPRFLHKVMPSYPEFAREQGMHGTVILHVTIDEHGRVVNVQVLRKAGFGFDAAAVEAIRQSTFIPAKNEGKFCCCKVIIPIRFELH